MSSLIVCYRLIKAFLLNILQNLKYENPISTLYLDSSVNYNLQIRNGKSFGNVVLKFYRCKLEAHNFKLTLLVTKHAAMRVII